MMLIGEKLAGARLYDFGLGGIEWNGHKMVVVRRNGRVTVRLDGVPALHGQWTGGELKVNEATEIEWLDLSQYVEELVQELDKLHSGSVSEIGNDQRGTTPQDKGKDQ